MENNLKCNKENQANSENVCVNEKKEAEKEKEANLSRKVSFIRESVSDSGVPERKHSSSLASDAPKRSSVPSHEAEAEHGQALGSPKVPKKFISTWRQACDRTKDRTKELLKRWRTLPEGNTEMLVGTTQLQPPSSTENPHNWSVHVWASYIKRYPSEDENLMSYDEKDPPSSNLLSSIQKEKLSHFFSHLLDSDHDDLISEQDFENFSEKLRRFADWSTNSPHFLITIQVQQGFLDTFLSSEEEIGAEGEATATWKRYLSLEDWLNTWGLLVSKACNLNDFPLWLHYLPKLLFQAINRSGNGLISRDELGSFYSSILGFTTQRVGEILDEAFNSLTSNGDHPVSYSVYRLAFTNFLLGRHPNGPGQYLFGCVTKKPDCFPIDYSALNCQPEDREHYTPDKKSNRVSIVV